MQKDENININEFSPALDAAVKELQLSGMDNVETKCHFDEGFYFLKSKYAGNGTVVLTVVFNKTKTPILAKYLMIKRIKDKGKSEFEEVSIVYYKYKTKDKIEKMTGEEVEKAARELRDDQKYTLLRLL